MKGFVMDTDRNVPPREDPSAASVIVVIDMVGYSTLARHLEENAGAAAVAQLNRQIQAFVDTGLAALPPDATLTRIAETGDGAILLFTLPEHAHRFAAHVLLTANQHNQSRTDESAKRWFRIGIASGEVTRKTLDQQDSGYAGIAIANAVRLESAAQPAEIVIELDTFEALPAPLRRLYGPESTVRGKRTELFRVRRYRLTTPEALPTAAPIRDIFARPGLALWAVAILLLGIVGFAGYSFLHHSTAPPFQTFQIKQITDTGDYIAAAVSPDGRYLLSAIEGNGHQSLWLRNLPTDSNTQIVAPAQASYDSLAFSSDGNYIYFRQRDSSVGGAYDLYRAAVLGAKPQLIVKGAESGASFSPDGKRIAFTRSAGSGSDKFSLLTSDLDGTNERVITTGPESFFPSFVAWSPVKQEIALATAGRGQGDVVIQLVSVASSDIKVLARFQDLPLDSIVWSPDGSGLLVTYETNIGYETRNQIGFISNPSGAFRSITSDTNHYGEVSVSSDGATLSSVQLKVSHTLYTMPANGFTANPPSPAIPQSRGTAMFGWGSNNSFYFGNAGSLLKISSDGTDRDTLLSDYHSYLTHPSVCSAGRYIVFVWSNHQDSGKTNIWRVGTDGSNPRQLTFGPTDVSPVCSPDGKWIYYDVINPLRIVRVPIDGGTPEQVPGTASLVNSTRLKLSSDGRFLVFFRANTDPAVGHGQIALVPLDAGSNPPVRLLDALPQSSSLVGLSPDGQAVISTVRDGSTENLWRQPLDGSPPRRITNFQADIIEFFEFSPDGKTLGVMRTHNESDVVLLQDSKAHVR